MPIDPSQVRWDDEAIDPARVQWDDAPRADFGNVVGAAGTVPAAAPPGLLDIITSGVQRGAASTLAGTLHSGADLVDQTVQGAIRPISELLGFDPDPLGAAAIARDSLGAEREINADRAAATAAIGGRPGLAEAAADPLGAAAQYGRHILNIGSESLPVMLSAIATRNPELASGLLGATTGAQEYTDLRTQGVGRGDAAQAGALTGLIETAGEGIGLPAVMAPGRGVGGLARAALAEGLQEAPVQVGQQQVEDVATGHQTPVLQQLGDALDAFLVGSGLGAGGHVVSVATDKVAGRRADDTPRGDALDPDVLAEDRQQRAAAALARNADSLRPGPGPVAPLGDAVQPAEAEALAALLANPPPELAAAAEAALGVTPSAPAASTPNPTLGRTDAPQAQTLSAGAVPAPETAAPAAQLPAVPNGSRAAGGDLARKRAPLNVQMGGQEFPVDSVEEASAKFLELRDRVGDIGGMRAVELVDESGKPVGYIGHNGEVYEGYVRSGNWRAKPIYDPQTTRRYGDDKPIDGEVVPPRAPAAQLPTAGDKATSQPTIETPSALDTSAAEDDALPPPLDIRYGKPRIPASRTAPLPESTDDEISLEDLSPAERAAADRGYGTLAKQRMAPQLAREHGEADADANGLRPAVDAAVGESGVPVHFIRGLAGLPENIRTDIESRNRGRKVRTAALYDPHGKQVYVLTDTVTDPQRAAWHAAHEIAGHHGLRALVRDRAGLDTALDMALQNPAVASVADAIAKERRSSDRRLMAEEALAELAAATRSGNYDEIASRYRVQVPHAQRATLRGAIARFVERIKAMFGKGSKFSDADVYGLVENAWRAAKTGAGEAAADGTLESADRRPFAQQVADRLASHQDGGPMLDLGRTAAVLRMLGAPDLPKRMPPAVLFKIDAGKHGTRAALTQQQIARLPELIDDPVAVFQDPVRPDNFVVQTSMVDAEGLPVQVAIKSNGTDGHEAANVVVSAFGRVNIADWVRRAPLLYRGDKANPRLPQSLLDQRQAEGEAEGSGAKVLRPDDLRNFRNAARARPLESVDAGELSGPDAFAPSKPLVAPAADMPSRRPGESQLDYAHRVANKGEPELKSLQSDLRNMQKIGRANFRAMLAKQARMADVADSIFHEYRKLFDKADRQATLTAIDQWENGVRVSDPDARRFFDLMDGMFADRIARLRAAKPGALQDLVEHYFPHIWEDTGKATTWYAANTKRPLDGNKSFLKQRTWGTIKEGMASGLRPVSYNPVDLALLKLGQMDKFITFHEFKNDLQSRGWLKRVKAGERMPEGYALIDSPAFKGAHAFVVKGEEGAPDTAMTAHWNWAAPEPIAKDVNGYLAPSLYRYGAWKGLRYVQNVLMSTRLGFSMFHAGFTTLDNAVTHGSIGLNRLLQGDLAGAAKEFAYIPLSPVLAPFEGGHIGKVWQGKVMGDHHLQAILMALEEGGARRLQTSQQQDFNNALGSIARKFRRLQAPNAARDVEAGLRALLAGPKSEAAKVAGKAALNQAAELIGAVGELSSWLIHQKLVPAQKMNARVALLKFELDRFAKSLGKQRGDYAGIIGAMHPDTLRQISGRVVDNVDDRLGQMNYDNQFWPKIAREIAQSLIGAVGWQVGTVRTVTGGVRDLKRLASPEPLVAALDKEGTVTDAHMGRLTNRVTNLLMLGTMMGGLGVLTQLLLAGEPPEEPKDLFFPKTGRKNPDDSDERLQFPSYWMDHFKIATHPLQTASHKVHPSIGMALEVLSNEDYFGVRIRDEDAPLHEQAGEVAQYFAQGFVPYSITGQKKLDDSNATAGQRIGNFFGVTSAPASVSRSAFQAFVAEKSGDNAPRGARTQEQAEHTEQLHEFEAAVRRGESPDMSLLTEKERKAVASAAKHEVPALRFKRLGLEDKLRAWGLATPEERVRYKLRDLFFGARASAAQANAADRRIEEAIRRLPEQDQEDVRQQLTLIRMGPAEGYPKR